MGTTQEVVNTCGLVFSTLEHQRSWFQTCPQTQTKLTKVISLIK